jgi:polysaccharide deacetylase 2 family uncharacterized protein YibQ
MARRGERPPIGLAWIVTWPLSAAFAAMVFLAGEELRHPGRTTEVAPPPPTGGADWSARFPERIAAIDAALHKAPLDLPKPIEDERGSGQLRWTHRLYTIDLSRAQRGQAETAIDALRGVDPGLTTTADNTTAGTDVRIGLDGLLVSTLRFRFVEAVTPKPPKPRLAVVIGPLGDDLRVARQVVAIEGPVVLSVRPFRPFSREVAELARMFQHEVLVQLDGSESEPSEGGALAVADLDAVLASVPQAVGVVWQGAAGSSPRGGRRLLEALERRQLLYVGEPIGAGGSGAPPLPAPAVIAGDPPDALAAQLSAVLDKARSDNGAIAFGAPTEATLAALTQVLPEWRAADVEVVPVTQLAPAVNLSAR